MVGLRDILRTIRVMLTDAVAVGWYLATQHESTNSEVGLARAKITYSRVLQRLAIDLEVLHTERVPTAGGVILMWNQESHLDHLVLALALPRPFLSLYNNAVARVPLYGKHMRRAGHVHVDRTNEAQWRAAIAHAAELARGGQCILVSPEGTRSWDGELLPMKRGALMLALEAGVPVVCVTVIGGHRCMPRGSPWVRSGAIRVVFSEPIDVAGLTPETLAETLVSTFGAYKQLHQLSRQWLGVVDRKNIASRDRDKKEQLAQSFHQLTVDPESAGIILLLQGRHMQALIPAITHQSGHYRHTLEDGNTWTYDYDIHAAGTRSERRIGWLRADGLDAQIAAAVPGDSIDTPWGLMQRMTDSPYERGFLLERAHGGPIDPSQGEFIEVPSALLMRDGRWEGQIGAWKYTVFGQAMGSKSERRIGLLKFDGVEVVGDQMGNYVDTHWGRSTWTGSVNFDEMTDYEQGFLLWGTHDCPLVDDQGEAVFPDNSVRDIQVELESLYLGHGFRGLDRPFAVRSISLRLSGNPWELSGTLVLDPNVCTLNAFGDTQGCTKMGVRIIEVDVSRLRLVDPKHLGRWAFSVTGAGLSHELCLIVQGELEPGKLERCYLKVGDSMAPLYIVKRP